MTEARIGLDVGGVIIDSRLKPVSGAFAGIIQIIEMCGSDKVWIISKCNPIDERKIQLWLKAKSFYRKTGFRPGNLYVCRERVSKAPIAADLKLTHYVDNHDEVLRYMDGTVANRLLFGLQPRSLIVPKGIHSVTTWTETVRVIKKTITFS